MRIRRPAWLLTALLVTYLVVCSVAAVFIVEVTLHPARRSVTPSEQNEARNAIARWDASLDNVPLAAADGSELCGWLIKPKKANQDAVILFHGLADNRLGMVGYAEMLTAHGYAVLMPDARAHGLSDGAVATHGLWERDDIRRWFDWMNASEHPTCIYGLGESMGAAQLLQSLDAEPHFCAVAAESPFSNFREIAYDRLGQHFDLGPWFGRSILRPVVEIGFLYAKGKYALDMNRVSPEESVARTTVPVLLIHGQQDSNIPVRHSQRIAARNPHVLFWEVPNTDHCGAISTHPEEFEQKLLGWFKSHSRGHS